MKKNAIRHDNFTCKICVVLFKHSDDFDPNIITHYEPWTCFARTRNVVSVSYRTSFKK